MTVPSESEATIWTSIDVPTAKLEPSAGLTIETNGGWLVGGGPPPAGAIVIRTGLDMAELPPLSVATAVRLAVPGPGAVHVSLKGN